MKALILAAGFGNRLQPLTNFIPKPMVPVAGVPNIERLIRHLYAAGFTSLRINLHHLPAPLLEYLHDGNRFGVHIDYFHEPRILGTGGGIGRMLEGCQDDLFVVVNGDVLFTPALATAIAQHRQTGAIATLITQPSVNAQKLGAVAADNENRIRRLVHAGDQSLDSLMMFTGVHLLSPRIKKYLPSDGCIVRKTYMPMVERGDAIFACVDNSYFCDIGTPESYLQATVDLLTGRAHIEGFQPPDDGIFIGENVTMEKGARVSRGCAIGNHAVIQRGVTLENTVVLPHATVTQHLTNAIVCPNGSVIQL